MGRLRFLSKIEQVAAFLREELADGKWSGEIPGKEELAIDLGVNAKTVGLALQLLEREGLLVNQGSGRRRRIVQPESSSHALKIKILLYDNSDYSLFNKRELIHQLSLAGHQVTVVEKTMVDLGMNLERVANYVGDISADAWIVTAGTREIIEWFSRRPVPVLAQFGQNHDLEVSSVGIDKITPMRVAVDRLIELGHRRIVMLARCERRKPRMHPFEQAFLDQLQSHGIATGAYHLPEWASNIADFHRCLESLFGKTPPTAMIIDESVHFLATQLFLARRGMVAPRDVSMICLDLEVAFSWCDPMISHINWKSRPLITYAVKWANRIAAGNLKIMHSSVPAQFIEGGTIGPVFKG